MPLRKSISRFMCQLLVLGLILVPGLLSAQTNPAIELYEHGERALAAGELYEAIDHFKESLSQNPDYGKPLHGLAEAYFKLGEYEQALIYIRRARRFARNDINIAALEGRIYTGIGRYDEAEELFSKLIELQPYNREALFGMAELHVARGNLENALSTYRSALASDPYNRRGLLSAALLYAAQNEFEAAGELIQTAVDTYPEDPVVHAIGAEYYLQSNQYEKSESHAWQAIALDPANEDALSVLINLLFKQERFEEAVDAVDRSIGLNQREPLLWFLRGKAFWELGQRDNALESFYTALDLRPSDEISRIVLEEFLLREYIPESEERQRAAVVRFERGSAYERDNRIELARQEYRRGLMLHPYNREGRVLYANTYKRSGNIAKYLSILKVLEIDGNTTQAIRDEIEIYQNLRRESIAEDWNVDQFGIDRFHYRFALYTMHSQSSLIHLKAAVHLSSYMQGLLQGYESIELVENSSADSFAEAFRSARSQGADFFVLLTYRETDRSFRVSADVYNARTGGQVETFQSIRTGNNRISQSLVRTVESLAGALPIRGTIYRRRGDEVLVDIGEFQDIEEENTLLVIREEHLNLKNNTFELEYQEENLLGEIRIAEVDDLLGTGTVEPYNFFDLVNPGDTVFPKPEEEQEEEPETESPEEAESRIILSDIYNEILNID